MAAQEPHDPQVEIRGFFTDPKRVGYQILTNYESTYWRALIGNDAWSLYEVLRSFCHKGNDTCNPSIRLLTTILGFEDKRALIGRLKIVDGKEYCYPGLIEILQEYKLVVAEILGEEPETRYLFHVNLTPDGIMDEQIVRLPKILQEKHAELIKRCQQEQQALDAKRKPARFQNGKKNSGGSSNAGEWEFPTGGMGISHGGDGNFPPKQYPINNTQLTINTGATNNNAINNNSSDTTTKNDVVVAFSTQKIVEKEEAISSIQTASEFIDPIPLSPPSPTVTDGKAEATAALLNLGLAETVARRLVSRYRFERILEKIDFLAYLQEQAPERVKNPRGWVRRAIEDNYAAPDGFLSQSERDRLAQEAVQRAEAARVAAELARAQQASSEAQQEAFRQTLQAYYGTTAEDYAFWEEVKRDLRYLARPDIFAQLDQAHILQRTEDTVLIGLVQDYHLRQVSHPGTQIAIKRVLDRVAGRSLTPTFVLVTPPGGPVCEPA